MELDFKKLKRNPKEIMKYLTKKDSLIFTNKDLFILFPEKFVDRSLSILGNDSYILGIFMIVDEKNNYSVSLVPTRLEIQADEVENILLDDIPYIKMEIKKGNAILNNVHLVKDADLVYELYDLFFIKGNVPSFLEYEDIPKLFDNLQYYTGSKASENKIVFEILTSIIARSKEKPDVEIRNIVTSLRDLKNVEYVYIGLNNIWLTFNSTLSKVAGSYMSDGIVSAINRPETEISDLEHLVRE